MLLLNSKQSKQKIQRIAYQILENNYEKEKLFIVGVNKNGLTFANIIVEVLRQVSTIKIEVLNITLNHNNPLDSAITIDTDIDVLTDSTIILVDDVANTGKTLFYAIKPLLEILPAKIEVAVLVDRKHKNFPIQPDFVGTSLHTTLQDHIAVKLDGQEINVYLN